MNNATYYVIYFYTTTLNQKEFGVKVGSASRNASSPYDAAKARIKEQLTAKDSADPYTIIHVEDISDLCTSASQPLAKLRQVEKGLHKKLKQKGMWKHSDNKVSEWFLDIKKQSTQNVVDTGIKLINEVRHGVQAITTFKPLSYQQRIINWACNKLKTCDDVLINAIMRAGKCFITHEIARKSGFKNILIVTAKPCVNDGWEELLPQGNKPHKNYTTWKYHDYNLYKKNSLSLDGNVNVVFISLQFVNTHFNNPNLFLQSVLYASWDLVVFDEQHYATETEKTKRFFSSLRFKKKIELSGTPYKTILSGRYDQNNIYNFDYVMEQKLRNSARGEEAESFKYRADINYAMLNVPDNIKAYIGHDGFTFLKLFATNKNGKFLNDVAVSEFLQYVVQTYKKPPSKFLEDASKVCRHALWILPNDVSAINAIAEKLQTHPFFSKRIIINASGGVVTDIQEVKNLISKSNFEGNAGTITLTCGRFLEGTSVPEWWTVHQMNNDKSAQDYFQGCFRNKTPWIEGNKQSVLVYDYAPERLVNVVYQYCEQVSIVENKPVNDILREWLNCSEVYDYVGNQWNIMSGEEITSRFLSDIKNHMDRIGNAIDANAIDQDIIDLMLYKQSLGKNSSSKTQLNTNNIIEGKNKKQFGSGNKNNSNKKDIDPVEETSLRIRYALTQLFKLLDIAWSEGLTIKNVNDIINYKDVSIVEEITGLVPREWATIMPALNIVFLNRAIGQYNDFQ